MIMLSVNKINAMAMKTIIPVLVLLLVLVASFAPIIANADVNPDLLNDGLPVDEQIAIQESIAQASANWQCQRSLLIVDSTRLIAYWGIYRFSQLTQPGWNLFEQTVDWALDHKDHSVAKIWLATYNGTLDSTDGREKDAFTAYNFLIDSMGIQPQNIEVQSQTSVEIGNFTGYDLLIYTNTYARDVQNVLNQNIPFITTSIGQTVDLGIGTNDWVMHASQDHLVITDESHEITSSYSTGLLALPSNVWMNATYVSGNGRSLIVADTSCYYAPVVIKMRSEYGQLGDIVQFDVVIDQAPGWFSTNGFDFTLTYDTTMLEAIDIVPGQLLNYCGWEFFVSKIDDEGECLDFAPCPKGTIKFVAIADEFSTPEVPLCLVDTAGTLAQITFKITEDPAYICSFAPVQFMWYDCGDNSMVAMDSNFTMNISKGVYDNEYYGGGEITADSVFPTRYGAPSDCDHPYVPRRIDFVNSGVGIACIDSISNRGDINLNEIANEIADVVLFSYSFIQGLSVFIIDTDKQIAASDVNADGFPLTLDDYVYLWRIIMGEVLPFPTPPAVADTAFFEQDLLNKTVKINYAGPINAVFLVFEGDIEPWGWAGDSSGLFDGTNTRILMDVWSWQDTLLFSYDSLMFYTGDGILVGAFASYDGLTPIPVSIVGGGAGCCLMRGDADNSGGAHADISDLVFLVQHIFKDGPAPPCIEQADIIPNWSLDISDITAFVDYMFLGGPPLLPCQ